MSNQSNNSNNNNRSSNQSTTRDALKKKIESVGADSYSARRKNHSPTSPGGPIHGKNKEFKSTGKEPVRSIGKKAVSKSVPVVGKQAANAVFNKRGQDNGSKVVTSGAKNPLERNPFRNTSPKPPVSPQGNVSQNAPVAGKNSSKIGGITTPTSPHILEEEETEELLEEGEGSEESFLSGSSPDRKSRRSKRKKGTADGSFEGDLKTILKKALPIIIPLAVIAVAFFLFSLLILLNVDNFSALLGINSKTGGPTDEVEFDSQDKEEEAFYERVKEIYEEYKAKKWDFDPQLVGAVFFIMQTHNTKLTFADMTKEAVQEIVDAMFIITYDEFGNEIRVYDKATFIENLKKDIFPKYMPKTPEDQYDEIIDEIWEYLEDYKDLLEIQDIFDGFGEGGALGIGGNTLYWWPIGSAETTKEEGVTFAKGNPTSTTVTSVFAGRVHPITGKISNHKGVDLVGANSTAGVENVIAALDGTVVYPPNVIASCESFGDRSCGGGYGNYIVIQHADGNYTLYAHLHQNTVTVKAGDTVRQGQVIAKMGSSGMSTGTHLHFEVRSGSNTSSAVVDPMNYIDASNPRPVSVSGGSNWSLERSSLSKAEFVAKMNDYCKRSGNTAFCTNFAAHAESIYDTAHAAGVNPELVVVTAGTEQGWKTTCGYNFYGIGIANGKGCSSGASYATLEDGIRGYAATLAQYRPGGKFASAIEQRYNERKAAGCDPAGHGKPGTLQGMQSVYSWLGDYRYNPGSWGKGGCPYLKLMYPNYPYCTPATAAIDNRTPTTVCEQNDYTAFQLKGKYEYRQAIFGI